MNEMKEMAQLCFPVLCKALRQSLIGRSGEGWLADASYDMTATRIILCMKDVESASKFY